MRNATQSSNFYAVQQTESAKVKGDQDTGQYYQHIQDELKVYQIIQSYLYFF
jgi:hypothetical protein